MKDKLIDTISIILTIVLITTNLYISVTKSIAPEQIRTNIENNLLTGFIYDDNGDKTEIFKTILKLTQLDEETVINLMNNPTADEIITDIVNSIYDYNLTNDENYKYTKDQIINIVIDNIDQVMDEINYPLTTLQRNNAIEYTKNNTDYILNTIYATNIGDYTK